MVAHCLMCSGDFQIMCSWLSCRAPWRPELNLHESGKNLCLLKLDAWRNHQLEVTLNSILNSDLGFFSGHKVIGSQAPDPCEDHFVIGNFHLKIALVCSVVSDFLRCYGL